jgi:hypothetical protein
MPEMAHSHGLGAGEGTKTNREDFSSWIHRPTPTWRDRTISRTEGRTENMAWLTVREAAEWLDISEAAVRKRIQRSTLAHRRSDGHVYIYREADETAETGSEEDAGTESADGGNQNTQRSWWDYAAGVSALVIVFGGLIYALGLFVLFAPIAMTYTRDLSAAGFATFLVPRAVVAGLGVWRLVAFPLLVGTLMFALSYIVGYVVVRFVVDLTKRFPDRWRTSVIWVVTSFPALLLIVGYASWRIATGPSPLAQAPYWAIVVLVLALISILGFTAFLTAFLIRQRLRLATLEDIFDAAPRVVGLIFVVVIAYQVWHWLILPRVPDLEKTGVGRNALMQAALVIGAGTTVAVAATWATNLINSVIPIKSEDTELEDTQLEDTQLEDTESEDTESEDRYWVIFLAFLIVSAAAFIAAFTLAIPSNPPLPKVVIDVKERKKNTTGNLLTHAEGFWYIFEENDNQPGRRLTAIPDDEVREAWVSKVPAR